ncbi:long-chain fatty acid--CoA ligase [Enteractinococcus fodinae]|uniref:Long-chain acyl-CoA synthetase n=1 Tax=Enteractinococcus fodinae TaxID=684663 RepID=A0ABU2B7F5_9MICC|nr:AMP-binding protein [Enteractinococcus fodinae]MDR7348324.1 long-chain acyl-CoA synthetase [Enteractinococcus fodinae]
MTNAAHLVWGHAVSSPSRLALREGEREWTFEQLRAAITDCMTQLRQRGVGRGDHVLVVLPTSAEFVIAYHALLALGATAVTVNTLSTVRELNYFLADAECTHVIGWHESQTAVTEAAEQAGLEAWILRPEAVGSTDEVLELAEVSSDDAAVLLYTSGTTGSPKGAVLTHRNLLACGKALSTALEVTADDAMGTALPLFHVFGQAAVMFTVYSVGASLTLLRPFDGAALLELAARHSLTAVAGVPTMWNAMLHADTKVTREDLSALRLASSGGAALPLKVAEAFKERFGAQVLDGYGLSETTGATTFSSPDNPRKEMSVGRAVPGVDIAILDDHGQPLPPGESGEVAVAGPVVMREYWKKPDKTAEVFHNGWFLTGDIGRMDEDGDLWIVDRKKDLVIRGGYNVYPREIEEVLYAHPAVLEAAVIGVSDERLGEELAAVVALHPGQELEPEELRTWLEERLAAYKVPRIYQQVDALVKGATGKILKRKIDREAIATSGARPSRVTR